MKNMLDKLNEQNAPALYRILNKLDYSINPSGCAEYDNCPFAVLLDEFKDVRNDLSEAHYQCTLLNKKVWGEDPVCTEEDWRKKAAKELRENDLNIKEGL